MLLSCGKYSQQTPSFQPSVPPRSAFVTGLPQTEAPSFPESGRNKVALRFSVYEDLLLGNVYSRVSQTGQLKLCLPYVTIGLLSLPISPAISFISQVLINNLSPKLSQCLLSISQNLSQIYPTCVSFDFEHSLSDISSFVTLKSCYAFICLFVYFLLSVVRTHPRCSLQYSKHREYCLVHKGCP